MVARIDLDRQAQPGATEFYAAVIHSRGRLDYPGVAAALGGDIRGKRRKYEQLACPRCARWTRWRGRCASPGSRAARSTSIFLNRSSSSTHDDPRLVRAIRKSRRDPGERQAYR